MLPINFGKAFDPVEHNVVLKAMKELDVDDVYLRIIRDSLEGLYTEITLFKNPIRVDVCKGIKQGVICSPKVFTCTLESILRKILARKGFNIGSEELSILLFVDDLLPTADDPHRIQDEFNELNVLASNFGLPVNSSKARLMKNSNYLNFAMNLRKETVKIVEEHVYSGKPARGQ